MWELFNLVRALAYEQEQILNVGWVRNAFYFVTRRASR